MKCLSLRSADLAQTRDGIRHTFENIHRSRKIILLRPKIQSKIKPSIEKVKKMASMHALKKNNLPHLQE